MSRDDVVTRVGLCVPNNDSRPVGCAAYPRYVSTIVTCGYSSESSELWLSLSAGPAPFGGI